MIYVFNKNKIISYTVASVIVLLLFSFSTTVIPNKSADTVKTSSNVSNMLTKNVIKSH